MKLIDALRDLAVQIEASNGEVLNAAADQIEWFRIVLQEIADRNRCTCEQEHIDRKVSAPNCPAHLAGDDAREALGQNIECLGRLARRRPPNSYN